MSLCRRCERLCNNYGISKFIYLGCSTLVTAGFIIECILIHLVVVPYTSESTFKHTTCRYNSSIDNPKMMRCENKCTKERSNFPCLPVKVRFRDNTEQLRIGFIFDYYRTYNEFKTKKVRILKRWFVFLNCFGAYTVLFEFYKIVDWFDFSSSDEKPFCQISAMQITSSFFNSGEEILRKKSLSYSFCFAYKMKISRKG